MTVVYKLIVKLMKKRYNGSKFYDEFVYPYNIIWQEF